MMDYMRSVDGIDGRHPRTTLVHLCYSENM